MCKFYYYLLIFASAIIFFSCNKDESNDSPNNETIQSDLPPFPYLEVSESSNYEIGFRVGSHFKFQINEFYRRAFADKINNPESPFNGLSLIEILISFVESDPGTYYDPFYDATQDRFPEYLEELKGVADGAEISFKTIFTSACQLELISLITSANPNTSASLTPLIKGCSSVSYSNADKCFLAHNEDIFTDFADLMFVIKVEQTGKPTFLSLNYPTGAIGIPPGMNDAGVVYSGNQVDIPKAEPGVPFVFLCRAMLDAGSINHAKTILESSNPAYSTHFNIGSFNENKIISAEVMPGKHAFHIVDNFYAHTNHFVLPTMNELSLETENSIARRAFLMNEYDNYVNKPDEVTADLITNWMSSHDGYPNAVCVHLDGGLTVAHSMFDFQNKTWKLYRGNPCNKAFKVISF